MSAREVWNAMRPSQRRKFLVDNLPIDDWSELDWDELTDQLNSNALEEALAEEEAEEDA